MNPGRRSQRKLIAARTKECTPARTWSGAGFYRRAYNICVIRARRQHGSAHKPNRHPIYATETSGLLLVAFLLLVLIVVRYWHAIHWSLR